MSKRVMNHHQWSRQPSIHDEIHPSTVLNSTRKTAKIGHYCVVSSMNCEQNCVFTIHYIFPRTDIVMHHMHNKFVMHHIYPQAIGSTGLYTSTDFRDCFFYASFHIPLDCHLEMLYGFVFGR